MSRFIIAFIICLSVFISGCRCTYEGIEGVYHNDYMGYCRIYGDTMDIYTPDLLVCGSDYPSKQQYVRSTRCSVRNIEGDWFSVSSIDSPESELFRGMQVIRIKVQELSDSIDIEFILPNFNQKIKIVAYADTCYEAIADAGRCCLRLPVECEEFTLAIEPLKFRVTMEPALFYGLVCFRYNAPIACDVSDRITILLPGLTSEVLDAYYLENEYIRITRRGLEMLGEFWKRGEISIYQKN